ncbi:MAG: hypothetical protein AB9856_03545 [Cellulosilyticaceae bacterium]
MAVAAKVESIDSLTVSASVLADLLGVTDRRVRQLAEEGIFIRVSKGRYNLPESIKTYINMLKMEQDIVNAGAADGLDLETERAIKTRVERKQAEIKLALMKGEVHKAAEVEQVMTDMLTSFRTRLLNVPAKLAPILVSRSEMGHIKNLITNEVIEVLNELKEYNPADFYANDYIEYDEDEVEDYGAIEASSNKE